MVFFLTEPQSAASVAGSCNSEAFRVNRFARIAAFQRIQLLSILSLVQIIIAVVVIIIVAVVVVVVYGIVIGQKLGRDRGHVLSEAQTVHAQNPLRQQEQLVLVAFDGTLAQMVQDHHGLEQVGVMRGRGGHRFGVAAAAVQLLLFDDAVEWRAVEGVVGGQIDAGISSVSSDMWRLLVMRLLLLLMNYLLFAHYGKVINSEWTLGIFIGFNALSLNV